jgi:hypothetical protein
VQAPDKHEAKLAAAQVLSPLFAQLSTLTGPVPSSITPRGAWPQELAVMLSCSPDDAPTGACDKTVQALMLPRSVPKKRSGWQKALIGCAAL